MQLYVNIRPDLPEGGPVAHMNPGSGEPFGVIEFGDNAYVAVMTDDEARRVIAAAAATIEMRKAIGTPHKFEPSAAGSVIGSAGMQEYYCLRCGMGADSGDHAVDMGEYLAGFCGATTGPDAELDVTLYCDREAGHPGSHHAPGPDEGSEVAWSDEVTAAAL
jgi:hypothetical protein